MTGATSNRPQFGILTATESDDRAPGGSMRTLLVRGHARSVLWSQSAPYTSNEAAPRARSTTVRYAGVGGAPCRTRRLGRSIRGHPLNEHARRDAFVNVKVWMNEPAATP
jgi:hypothetical protein